ncbi:MAG: histidine phosphatase family protein, partial [Actinomycetota bacterium]
MTTFLLLRHAHSVANNAGVLAGQLEGIGLSKDGTVQVDKLSPSFENIKIDRIISSPMQRCLETVEVIAKSKKMRISIDKRLIEMNYGSWSGRKLSKLSRMKDWKVIQTKPSA